ncbi:hypothetical protein BVRB_7g166030 [Beta vulgaris subsp. vulgaris]|nr:hypothetical protein BVRB_7g166030 [Beta vulgaris subsp. vulgaris]
MVCISLVCPSIWCCVWVISHRRVMLPFPRAGVHPRRLSVTTCQRPNSPPLFFAALVSRGTPSLLVFPPKVLN